MWREVLVEKEWLKVDLWLLTWGKWLVNLVLVSWGPSSPENSGFWVMAAESVH